MAEGQTPRHVDAALRWADWMEPLLRRESYLATVAGAACQVHERLLRMLGAARWPARYLLQAPGRDRRAGQQRDSVEEPLH